jgi:hypothetical protein
VRISGAVPVVKIRRAQPLLRVRDQLTQGQGSSARSVSR